MVRYEMDNYGEDATRKVIVAVSKRPPLYDRGNSAHNDKIIKEQLWNEVCEQVFQNWNDFPADKKESLGKEVQQRWHNVRYCFNRELRAQERDKSQPHKKRRKYVYYNELLFLRHVVDRETENLEIVYVDEEEVQYDGVVDSFNVLENSSDDNKYLNKSDREQVKANNTNNDTSNSKLSEKNSKNEFSGIDNDYYGDDFASDESDSNFSRACESMRNKRRKTVFSEDRIVNDKSVTTSLERNKTTCNELPLDTIVRKSNGEIDEDKAFLLSLVSSFRMLNEDQKLEAKIEILSAIKRVKSAT